MNTKTATITKTANGYILNTNTGFVSGASQYVFETEENLFKFLSRYFGESGCCTRQ